MMSVIRCICCCETEKSPVESYYTTSTKWAQGVYQKKGEGFNELLKFEAKVNQLPPATQEDEKATLAKIRSNIQSAKIQCEAQACFHAGALKKLAAEWNAPNIWQSGRTIKQLDNLIHEIDNNEKELSHTPCNAIRTEMAAVRAQLVNVKNKNTSFPPFVDVKITFDNSHDQPKIAPSSTSGTQITTTETVSVVEHKTPAGKS